jgi:hypothetical protein
MSPRGAAQARVLGALDVPRTTGEVSELLRDDLWRRFCIEHGVDEEVAGLAAGHLPRTTVRLAATAWARERGTPMLSHPEVYNALRRLERLGLVHRLKLPPTRSVLWFRPLSETAEARR